MTRIMESFLTKVPIDEMAPADIAVFWFDKETKLPQHAGLLTERLGMIHTYNHVGRVVEMESIRHWKKRLLQVYRHPGVV